MTTGRIIGAGLIVIELCSEAFGAVDRRARGDDWNPAPGLIRAPVHSLIHYYRTRVSSNSIERCPFRISCSEFAEKTLIQYGTGGCLIRTIDRYFYRENRQAFTLYEKVEGEGGRIKLDDGFFLYDSVYVQATPEGDHWRPKEPPNPLAGMSDSAAVEFADDLYRNGDYDIARIIYERIARYSREPESRCAAIIKIAKCLAKEGKYARAVGSAAKVVEDPEGSDSLRSLAEQMIGAIYMKQRIFPLAETHFRKALEYDTSAGSLLGLAFVAMEGGHWDRADSLDKVMRRILPPYSTNRSNDIHSRVEQARLTKWRNQALAGWMSAILPGAGQWYSGHYFDGIQAFTFVTTFGLATYAAYRYESAFQRPRIGTALGVAVTGTFHIANIWGARQTALYRNMRMRQNISAPVREWLYDWIDW